MKAVFTITCFLISFVAHSAPVEYQWATYNQFLLGGSSGCSETTSSCYGSVYGPWVWETRYLEGEYNGIDPVDNNEYFYINYGAIGYDQVVRDMITGMQMEVISPVNVSVSWDSMDLFSGTMNIFGNLIDLTQNPFGSFEATLSAGFIESFITAKADSLDSYAIWSFTYELVDSNGSGGPITAETPIPASLLLFAPALLGLIGIRRKLS